MWRGLLWAGMKTEFGKTFEDMKDVESRRTPLQMKMDELGKQLSVLSFGIIGVIALVGVLQVTQCRLCLLSAGAALIYEWSDFPRPVWF